jgi:CubicO group peptidase (beta-lactamase class C family)
MLHKFFLILLLFNASLLANCQEFAVASGRLKPYKAESGIKIDGLLNEPVWQKVLFADRLYESEDSIQPYDNTKTYFTYDADNLYVAFKCKVKDNSLLPKIKLDKDDQTILGNEWVAFCIDTYNDGVLAYVFLVDAAGNQLDLGLNSGKDLTNSFSSEWTSALEIEADVYTIEMKIPLSMLPIRWNRDSVEMSIKMIRNDKQNNKELQKPFLNSKIGNNINQFQKVVLQGIHQTHPINLSGVDISARLAYKKAKIDLGTLLGRCKGGDASVMDYLIFKKRLINGADKPRAFPYSLQTESVCKSFENTDYMKNYPGNNDFETFLERSQTTAFLVLQNDTIVYERYFNGFNKNSIFTSFSVAKSFVSTLIGTAIEDGYIKCDTDRITTYIPELLTKDSRFSEITIKDLLSMSSGLAYSEDGFPSDADITYQDPDLRKAVLEHVRIAEAPGKHWHYNNYNPLLLGLILERTANMPVSKYIEEKLWKKMGGSNASWSLDEHGFEKMESGINCSAYDYVRFAALLLNNGKYNNTQVVPKAWVQKATQPLNLSEDYYDLPKYNIYYSYFWWGKLRASQDHNSDFFGMGNKGEYVYICPQKELIIIRLGFEYGLPTPSSFSWPALFYQFATDFMSTNWQNQY